MNGDPQPGPSSGNVSGDFDILSATYGGSSRSASVPPTFESRRDRDILNNKFTTPKPWPPGTTWEDNATTSLLLYLFKEEDDLVSMKVLHKRMMLGIDSAEIARGLDQPHLKQLLAYIPPIIPDWALAEEAMQPREAEGDAGAAGGAAAKVPRMSSSETD